MATTLICALYFTALVANGANAQGTLEVSTISSNIDTVLGCTETILCEGPGTSIEWTLGSGRDQRTITDKNTTVQSAEYVHSNLTLANISPVDAGKYQCSISIDSKFIDLSVTVAVSNEIVVIEPIQDIDISNKAVGETLSIECRVRTCHGNIAVSILKGSQLVEQKEIIETVGTVSLVANVTISSDTDELCACRVRLPDGTVFSEEFRITGTPLDFPTPMSASSDDPLPRETKSTKPTSSVKGSASVITPQILAMIILLLFVVADALPQ